jgi:tripartite-type tricarboxylate transporter receptor subunit TctC
MRSYSLVPALVFFSPMLGLTVDAQSASGPAARDYPVRTIRVIVPFAPGGGGDITARAVASKLSDKLNQQFVVDNRGGAGGLVGLEIAAKAQPDGYTIMMMSSSFSSTTATHRPSFDPINSVAPVGEIGISPFVLSVHPSLSVSKASELISLAKTRSGQLIYAIPGVGSITHLATELFLSMAGIRMVGVPYKGTGPAMIDLLSGRTQVIVGSLPPVSPYFESGQLRALAVTSASRWYSVPTLPTLSETLPGYVVENWYGVMVPRKTPQAHVETLNRALNEVLTQAELKTTLDREGVKPSPGTSVEFGKRMRADYERWVKVVADSNIRPQSD